MSGDGEIAVNEEARTLVRNLENYDPGAPSTNAMGTALGVNVTTGSQHYRNTMSSAGETVRKGYDFVMGEVARTCANAISAIESMQGQDQEIAAILRKYEVEIEPMGGSTSSTSSSSGSTGTRATSW